MRVTVELPIGHYDRLFEKVRRGSREHAILVNSLFIRRDKGDHFERFIEILCDFDSMKTLLELAKQACPAAVPEIENAIAHFREM